MRQYSLCFKEYLRICYLIIFLEVRIKRMKDRENEVKNRVVRGGDREV